MLRVLLLIGAAALGACSTTGGTLATNGAPLSVQQASFVGNWAGRTPSGAGLRVAVSERGGVSYFYKGREQRLSNVELTDNLLRMNVEGSSRVTLTPSGAYTFVYGPTGQVTKATLTKS